MEKEDGGQAFDTIEKLADKDQEDRQENAQNNVELEIQNDDTVHCIRLRVINFDESNPTIDVLDSDSFVVILDKIEAIVGHRCTFEFGYQNSWFIVDDEDTLDAFLEWVETESNGQSDIRIAETNWKQDPAEVLAASKNIKSTSKFYRMILYPIKAALNFWGISTGAAHPSVNLITAAAIGLVFSLLISVLAFFFRELGLSKSAGDSFPSDQTQLGAISGFIAAPIFLTALCCGDMSNRWGRLAFKDFFCCHDPKLGYPDCFSLQMLRLTACSLIGIPTSIACIALFCIREEVRNLMLI
jgi:hypothetical protein